VIIDDDGLERKRCSIWQEFMAMESWPALASSPDAQVIARTWTDGCGGAGTRTLDVNSKQVATWDTGQRTIMMLACNGLRAVAAIALRRDNPSALELLIWDGTSEASFALEGDLWTLVSCDSVSFVAVPRHNVDSSMIVAGAGTFSRVRLGHVVVTSVAGSRRGTVFVNARDRGSEEVRLASIDAIDGTVTWFESGTLAVRVDQYWLVTTTLTDPNKVRLIALSTATGMPLANHSASEVALDQFSGDLTVCAVRESGDEILLGVHAGVDDGCWSMEVSSGTRRLLSDPSGAFGIFAFFSTDGPVWAESSPVGGPVVMRDRELQPSGDGEGTAGSRKEILITAPHVSWSCAVTTLTTMRSDGEGLIQSIALAPEFWSGEHIVITLHGGPRSRWMRKYSQIQQMFVAAGVLVIAPNTRGSASDEEEFERDLRGRWGDVDQADLADVVGDVRRLYPHATVVLVGQSYGAYQAFQAVIADSSICDGAVLAAGFSSPERLIDSGPKDTKLSLLKQHAAPSVWARGIRCSMGMRICIFRCLTSCLRPISDEYPRRRKGSFSENPPSSDGSWFRGFASCGHRHAQLDFGYGRWRNRRACLSHCQRHFGRARGSLSVPSRAPYFAESGKARSADERISLIHPCSVNGKPRVLWLSAICFLNAPRLFFD